MIRIDSFRDLFRDYPGVDAVTFSTLNKKLIAVHVTISRKEFMLNNTEEQLNELIKVRMRRVEMYD